MGTRGTEQQESQGHSASGRVKGSSGAELQDYQTGHNATRESGDQGHCATGGLGAPGAQ